MPSANAPKLLFMGPFRYAPNAIGIRAFVEQGWQAIRAAHPQATLTILGGPEATSMGREAWLQAPGIELIDRFVDPAPHLARASLTINPQLTIRGSALKLIESLLAARICVTTRDGARGFQAGGSGRNPNRRQCRRNDRAHQHLELDRSQSSCPGATRAGDAAVLRPGPGTASPPSNWRLYRRLIADASA